MPNRPQNENSGSFVAAFIFAILAPPVGIVYLPIIPLGIIAIKKIALDGVESFVIGNDLIFFIGVVVFCLFWSILSFFTNNLESYEYILSLMRMIIIFSVFVLVICMDNTVKLEWIYIGFVLAATINALVVFYQMVIITIGLPLPMLRLADTFYGGVPYTEAVRTIGLMAGHDSSSLLSLVGFVLTYGQREVVVVKNRFLQLLMPIFFLAALVFSGRTGLLLALSYVLLCPFFDRRLLGRSALFVASGIIGIGLIYQYGGHFGDMLVRRAFSVFISYFETGTVYDYSAADTLQSYSIPAEWQTYIFGNSLPSFHRWGPRSDSAFMQWLYGNGLLVLAALLICVFSTIFLAYRRVGPHCGVLLFLLLVACIKGPYIFSKITAELYFAILIVLSRDRVFQLQSGDEPPSRARGEPDLQRIRAGT